MEVWRNSSRVLYDKEALSDREGCQTLTQITKEGLGINGHLSGMLFNQVCLEPGGWTT